MSVERHPHINAAGLAADFLCSIRENLRSEEHKTLPFEGLDELVLEFCERVERLIEWNIYLPEYLKAKIAINQDLSFDELYHAERLGLLPNTQKEPNDT